MLVRKSTPVWLTFVITVCTAGIGFVNSRADTNTTNFFRKSLVAISALHLGTSYGNKANYIELLRSIPGTSPGLVALPGLTALPANDEQLCILYKAILNGEISGSEGAKRISVRFATLEKIQERRYNRLAQEANQIRKKGALWNAARDALFLIQMIALCFLCAHYSLLIGVTKPDRQGIHKGQGRGAANG